tara:strand:- start:328 stop:1494 length:1167 start_codon:yes stop_codon:yes gene_type:complete
MPIDELLKIRDLSSIQFYDTNHFDQTIMITNSIHSSDSVKRFSVSWKHKILDNVLKVSIFFIFKFNRVKINGSHMGYGHQKIVNIIKMKLLRQSLLRLRLKNIALNKVEFQKQLAGKPGAKKILALIPDFFFGEIHNSGLEIKKVIGAPLELQRYPWFKLYFLESNTFQPVTHGGGNYSWKDSKYEFIEYLLAGGRYCEVDKDLIKDSDKNNKNSFNYSKAKMCLALRAPSVDLLKNVSTSYTDHISNAKSDGLLKSLYKLKIPVRHHPRGINSSYNNFLIDKLNVSKNFNEVDLYIFDAIDSSLEYQCILKNIPYIYIVDKIPEKHITKKYNSYIKKLIDEGGILISNSEIEIINYLKSIQHNIPLQKKILNVNKSLHKFIRPPLKP